MKRDKAGFGVLTVSIAYIMWGVLTIFWNLLSGVNPVYILAHRIIWSAVFMGLYVLLRHRGDEIRRIFGNRKMPTLSGIAMVFHQIGSFISTWLGSVLIASSGGYTSIWLCGAFVAGGAAVLCYTIKDRRG